MSKARARERKKARLAKARESAQAGASSGTTHHEAGGTAHHETGVDHTPADQVAARAADKTHPGKFDAKAPPGGGVKATSAKGAPNLAASTRGSARSR